MSPRSKRCIRSSNIGELLTGWPRDRGSGACGIGECRTAGISRSGCDSIRRVSIIFKTYAREVYRRRFRKPLGDQVTSTVLTTSCELPLLVCECSAVPGLSRLDSRRPQQEPRVHVSRVFARFRSVPVALDRRTGPCADGHAALRCMVVGRSIEANYVGYVVTGNRT